ncbi:MAG: HAMP domain-containing protein [SAR324 cluster bacterium]|nr:HAMP domain-containing protein [SAR324 cluster bacterium]MBL7034974.1 HAMP domain-containing protein [SAR324 cluster bacterium]
MSLRLQELLKNYKELIASDPNIRNRMLAVVVLLFLLLVLVMFSMQQGFSVLEQSGSQLMIFVAINVNIVLLAIVFYLIARNLLKLSYERRRHVLGVNLKTKLITSFIVLSLPAMGFHLFASFFIATNLESWLKGQQESMLHSAQNVSEAYHNNLRKTMELQNMIWENHLKENPGELEMLTPPKNVGADATLYSKDQELIKQWIQNEITQLYWKNPSLNDWYQIKAKNQTWFTADLGERYIYRLIRPIVLDNKKLYLETFYPATPHASGAVNEIIAQDQNSQFFTESEDLVRGYYLIIFLLMTLFIIFVATWLAFYLARGFVQPIEDLALATQRVSEGELGYQVELRGPLDKDFALLMQSFNSMSRDLLENQVALNKTTMHLQESHRTLESQIRFVELVLENITTGVMSLDMAGRVEILNHSAKQMLQLKSNSEGRKHYREVLEKESLEMFEEMVAQIESAKERSISRNLIVHKKEGPVQVSATLLLLQNSEGKSAGMVCVYNNITEIQRLQRARAWREVARRIAHEIKNPLTPIQLSAERIQRKYAGEVSDDVALQQSTQTIIKEVQHLKQMVSEFSNFAKIPETNPHLSDLNQIVREALLLYHENMPARISLNTELSESLPQLPLDSDQIRRVVINLVDNAISSIEKKGALSRIFRQGEIIVRTRHVPDLNIIFLDVEDNGTGISPEISDDLFEPYTTTKEHGTGLGLTIVSQTISDHNGFTRFRNLESGGVCFTIELPVA